MLQQFFCKGLCLLHRKSWNCETINNGGPNFYYSRKTAARSAITLLESQAQLHQISGPGHALEKHKWWKYGIINHDFLLAAMMLSLDLVCEQRNPDVGAFAGMISCSTPTTLRENPSSAQDACTLD